MLISLAPLLFTLTVKPDEAFLPLQANHLACEAALHVDYLIN